MTFNKNEEAVSPVIGVILMVAITVILAAVIAVFVFGMADDIDSGHTAAAIAKVSGENVVVTFQASSDKLLFLNTTLYDGAGKSGNVADTNAASWATTGPGFDTKSNPQIGYSKTFVGVRSNAITDAKDKAARVVVTATFDDGKVQVLLDKKL